MPRCALKTCVDSSCTEFLFFCEIHRQFHLMDELDPQDVFPNCCGDFFNPEPMFSTQGTCFTSFKEVTEQTASAVSAIKLWINVNQDMNPRKANNF